MTLQQAHHGRGKERQPENPYQPEQIVERKLLAGGLAAVKGLSTALPPGAIILGSSGGISFHMPFAAFHVLIG